MTDIKTNKKELKEKIQFIASLIVLVAGLALIFISLILEPVGIIHYTVLTAFGMLLSFVGAVWNLDLKFEYKTNELKYDYERRTRDFHRMKHKPDFDEFDEQEREDE